MNILLSLMNNFSSKFVWSENAEYHLRITTKGALYGTVFLLQYPGFFKIGQEYSEIKAVKMYFTIDTDDLSDFSHYAIT